MNRINIIDLRVDAHDVLNQRAERLFSKMILEIDDVEYRENQFFDDQCDFWKLVASLGVLSQYKRDRNPKFEQSTEMIQIGLSVALKQLDADEYFERDKIIDLIRGFAAYSGQA
ncbi:hypothetical protein [Methylobacterium sp. 174MFSha1.1]|uniref:hypothetical protein n=1 Tax=Methylobacterium sp. 174MFSha1.1 TaxID=1502749 RepID=UPI0011606FB6|nr:hypothetical protein [Methylobacterium sp. 174MFSha1.1]